MSAWDEPDWVGTMEFTCSSEVERKIITPTMTQILRSFGDEPIDPWAEHRSPEQIERMRVRMLESRVNDLLREWSLIEYTIFTCGWEGETEAVIQGERMLWTCPVCGEEHEDPAPDPDYYVPDTVKEAEGWA